MLTVRKATENDLLDVFKLVVAMHMETEFRKFNFNPEKALRELHNWIQNHFFVVVVDDGRVVGMMAGSKRDQWYSDDVLAAEDLLYVAQENRGTRAAYLLMREFMRWADQIGAQHIRAGVATGTGAGAERLYKHFGMNYVGGNFTSHLSRS